MARSLLQDRFARIVTEMLSRFSETQVVVVDYNQSLPEMVEAGKYDRVCDDINDKNFPIVGSGRVELELIFVPFNKMKPWERVLAELD